MTTLDRLAELRAEHGDGLVFCDELTAYGRAVEAAMPHLLSVARAAEAVRAALHIHGSPLADGEDCAALDQALADLDAAGKEWE